MRLSLVFVFLLGARWVAAQATACACNGLVNWEYRQPIALLDKPGGKVIRRLSHHVSEEDALIWQADRQQGDYLHVTVSYDISGKSATGWLKQAAWLGTYVRNYDAAVPLYAAPHTSALVTAQVAPEVPTTTFFPITRCGQGWVYVRAALPGQVLAGWLAPNKQCANQSRTCD